MILTALSKSSLYGRIHPRIARGLQYLVSEDWKTLDLGRFELEKDALYVQVQKYQTVDEASARWESHHIYTDIHYVVSGTERMGIGNGNEFSPLTEYDPDRDVCYFSGSGSFFEVGGGMVAIFSPHEIHVPRLSANSSMTVSKIVLKVRVEES